MELPTTCLAIETSGALGSVAVAVGGEVRARAWLSDGAHATGIVSALDEMMSVPGLRREELEAVIVGAGPGSFTGVRVAASTGKGLAHALQLPLFAVSSLEAAACAEWALAGVEWPGEVDEGDGDLPPPGERHSRLVLFDARQDRVYLAGYEIHAGAIHPLLEPAASTIDAVLASPRPADVVCVGEGAWRHAERLRAGGFEVHPPPAGIPTADGLLYVLGHGGEQSALEDRARWEPDYLRPSGAVRAGGP